MGRPRDASPTVLERAGTAAAGIGAPGTGRPRARAVLQWGIVVLIFGFLLGFLATQWSKLPDFDWRFEPGWLAAATVAVALFYLGQNEIWRLIVHALGEEIEARAARAVWGKSLLARYVPTNVLLVVGRVVLAERHGVKRRVTLASVVYEVGIGFGTAVMAGAYFAIQLPALEDQPARYAVLVLIPIVLTVLHPRVFAPAANFGLEKLGREPLPHVLAFSRVLLFAGLFLLTWAAIGFGLFAFAASLHPLSIGDLPYVAAAYPVGFCVAVLTFVVPGGLGTRDATLATALTAVLATTVATAIAVAFRIFQTMVELLYVAVVASLARARD